ncbi:nucleotide sugar dehydrogenase [Patescibacteria group bacterium AH-259-L07]|nr:nucleotide sugar dehydrogenase [Patescibacteria group bacterium AH-259-L07]
MPSRNSSFKYDICIIGGCGHIGAPLGILFASKGLKVIGYDVNKKTVNQMNTGKMWFIEHGCEKLLKKTLREKQIVFSADPRTVSSAAFLIICIGTPVDEHANPRFSVMDDLIKLLQKYTDLRNQILILRSTIYPGTTEYIQRKLGANIKIAFCPERLAQGSALKELRVLPQIVATPEKRIRQSVRSLFSKINEDIYEMDNFQEAELVKIINNTYRYLNFSISNQFFMAAQRNNLNFDNIYKATTYKYPRMKGFGNKGFVGGTCLYKDTMQLNAYLRNHFALGQAAMFINEGLPDFIIEILEKKYNDLKDKTVGILGMTFKANIDDTRESLSFKLKKILSFKAKEVKWHDPYLKNDKNYMPFSKVIECDIVVLATPHRYYQKRVNQLKNIKNFYNATYWQI